MSRGCSCAGRVLLSYSASTQLIVAGDGGRCARRRGYLTVGASGDGRGRAVAAQTQCERARAEQREQHERRGCYRIDLIRGPARDCRLSALRAECRSACRVSRRRERSRLRNDWRHPSVRRMSGARRCRPPLHRAALCSRFRQFIGADIDADGIAGGQARAEAGDGIGTAAGAGRHRGFPLARTVRHVSAQDNEMMDQAPSFAPLLGETPSCENHKCCV